MTSLFACAAILLGQGRAPAKCTMTIWLNGKKIGRGGFESFVDSSGNLHARTTSSLQIGEMKRDMVNDSLSDKRGRPIGEVEVDTVPGQKIRLELITGAKDLTLHVSANGKSNSVTVPLPELIVSDPSAFWFVNVRPKVGATVTYAHYNLPLSKWEQRTVKYVGDSIVPGTKIRGHHIHSSDGEQWVDDKGLPIRMEEKFENGTKIVGVRD